MSSGYGRRVRGEAAAKILVLLVAVAGCGRHHEARRAPETWAAAPSATAPSRAVATSATGESAGYAYDPAGNVLAIRAAATPLGVTGFEPSQGCPGQLVTVFGSGFAADPSQNTVLLGEIAAQVQRVTSTALAFLVPAGAGSGTITIAVGGSRATSASTFTVVSGITVTDFTPKMGKVGTVVSISGYNFSPTPSGNVVRFGGGSATPTTASVNTITATVGTSTSSGKVSVTAGGFTATSGADFVLLPGSLQAPNVGFTARGDYGASTAVAVDGPGKAGVVLFDGAQGQFLTLVVKGNTYPGQTSLKVYGPDGSSLFSNTVPPGVDAKYPTPALPASGTYTLVVQPATGASGTMSVQIYPVAVAPLVIDGETVNLSMAPGQDGRVTFSGNAGDYVTLAWPTSTNASSIGAKLYAPSGSLFDQWYVYPRAGHQQLVDKLPATGTYTLILPPPGLTPASLSLLGSRAVTGSVPTDGTSVRALLARQGQQGRFTFQGTAGRGYSLQATTGATFTTTTNVAISRRSGSIGVPSGTSAKLDVGVLPTTGTYTITVTPGDVDAGTVDLRVIPEDTAALAVDGPSTAVRLGAAQNGRYTFTGSAGDSLTLGVTGFSTSPAAKAVTWAVSRSGSSYNFAGSLSSDGSLRFKPLPETGTYTLTANPYGTNSASFSLVLSRPASGVVSADGTPTTVSLGRAGQTGQFTFQANAGERFTLLATAGDTFTADVAIAITQPSGGSLVPGERLTASIAKKIDLGALPTTGTYTVTLTPSGADTGSIDLRLIPYASVSLVQGGTSQAFSLASGQNGEVTFVGSPGDYASVAITTLATTLAGQTVSVQPLNPDGSKLSPAPTLNAPESIRLGPLTQSGTYRLLLQTAASTAASLTLRLSAPLTGSLTANGPAIRFSTTIPGQVGRYTFAASAGQGFTIQATAGSSFTGAVALSVTPPSGNSTTGTVGGGGSTKLEPGLPTAAGTYTVVVTPSGVETGTVDLRVILEDAGLLVVNGAARAMSIAAAQNGRYTFSGAAGDLRNLVCSSLSATPTGTPVVVAVLKPDGTQLTSRQFTSPATWQLPQLTAAGAYAVTVKPSCISAVSLTLQVTSR